MISHRNKHADAKPMKCTWYVCHNKF